ncbi:MAG: discoidin domain-containing protein [Oscillospiraceae bacterium]|nr:discoidin domain-containing protein [Oscillospiraceae bacterium]
MKKTKKFLSLGLVAVFLFVAIGAVSASANIHDYLIDNARARGNMPHQPVAPPENVFWYDYIGDSAIWHTSWRPADFEDGVVPVGGITPETPAILEIDLGMVFNLTGLELMTRQDFNGRIIDAYIQVHTATGDEWPGGEADEDILPVNGEGWTTVYTIEGTATGTDEGVSLDPVESIIAFAETLSVRYIRFVITETDHRPWQDGAPHQPNTFASLGRLIPVFEPFACECDDYAVCDADCDECECVLGNTPDEPEVPYEPEVPVNDPGNQDQNEEQNEDQNEDQNEEQNENDENDEEGDGIDPIIFVVIGVATVIIIGGIVFFVTKSKKAE